MSIYGSDKLVHHLPLIQKIGHGVVVPVHIHFIVCDLCNQDCAFCLIAGTMVETPHGSVAIEDIRNGDAVLGPDGEAARTGKTSVRRVAEVVELIAGGHRLLASPEHPILTSNGWKEAGAIRVGDSAVVRLRLRPAGEVTSGSVEQVCLRSARDPWEIQGRYWPLSQAEGEGQNSSRCTGQDVVGREPNEEQSQAPGCTGKDFVSENIKDRGDVCGLGVLGWTPPDTHRRRHILGWQEKPGLSRDRAEEADRGDNEGVFYRQEKAEDYGGVRLADDQALREQGLEVPSSVCQGLSLEAAPTISDGHWVLHGVRLERGLALRQIDSVRRLAGSFEVHNFSCHPHESYVADGFVVHNCAYRDELYPSNQLFGITSESGARNNNPNRMIPEGKVKEILRDAASMGVKAIQFTGGGEPTVHPHFREFLELCPEIGLNFSIVSNGVLWNEKMLAAAARATWVRISVDAGTANTYCSIRRVSETHFTRACKTISSLSAMETKPTVGVGFVVTKDNWREIVEGARLAKSLGADNIRLSAVFQAEDGDYFSEFYEEAAELCRQAKDECDGGGFTVYNNFGSRVSDLRQKQPDYDLCGFQHISSYIGGDQNIYRCCVTAYNNHGLLGSVKDMSFREAWFSDELQARLNGFNARSCDRCMYNDRNHFINYVRSDDPPHVNFV